LAYFEMEVKATKLNWYRDSSEWKRFHHDAAAMREFFYSIHLSLDTNKVLWYIFSEIFHQEEIFYQELSSPSYKSPTFGPSYSTIE
jgi:hypothetical protein